MLVTAVQQGNIITVQGLVNHTTQGVHIDRLKPCTPGPRGENFDVATLGGEEFVILLPEIADQDARTIGERLRASLEQIDSFYSPVGVLPGVTISIGLAQMRHSDSLSGLIARADAALYQAKQQGRNCLCG